jgi:ATP-dependent 26S proteasome regulatory subunit
MIYDNKLTAVLTFDEQILQMDDFFINFLMNDEQDILVIEDADLLITSREDHGNKLMSRILNISDGLIKHSSKKIVFSANLTKYDSIDQALMRPGRCHDVLDFRKLTADEAKNLAAVAGISHKLQEREEYTLAEIFEPEDHVARQPQQRKIGFV